MNAPTVIGQPVKRKEDVRFLTGGGTYTDDVSVPGQTHACFLRSPHAHARIRAIDCSRAAAAPGETYVAGLDLAGGSDATAGEGACGTWAGAGDVAQAPRLRTCGTGDVAQAPRLRTLDTGRGPLPHRDSTVLTVGRLRYADAGAFVQEPRVEIVEHRAWTGTPHEALLPQLADLLRNAWRVSRVAVDATGLGETPARLLATALGSGVVEAVKFTAELPLGLASAGAVRVGHAIGRRSIEGASHAGGAVIALALMAMSASAFAFLTGAEPLVHRHEAAIVAIERDALREIAAMQRHMREHGPRHRG